MLKRCTPSLLIVSFLLSLALPAWAGDASFRMAFTKPTNKNDTKVKIFIKREETVEVDIEPGISAKDKRKAIKDALVDANFQVIDKDTESGAPGIEIQALADDQTVKFGKGGTGERVDVIKTTNAAFSYIGFEGTYSSSDWDDGVAIFTAGVITALGEVCVQYRAADFPPGVEIDGTYLAERLFNDLLIPASDLGAHLFLDGHEILILFAGGGENGVIFGTTSPGEGLYGATGLKGDDDSQEPLSAQDDTAVTKAGTSAVIDVLANDTGDGDLEIVAVSASEGGKTSVNNDQTVIYDPFPGFLGDDTFTYTALDGYGQTATATVTVEVLPKN